MNEATLNIAIKVDDRGSIKIRELGRTAEKAGSKGEKSIKKMDDSLKDVKDSSGRTIESFSKMAKFTFAGVAAGITALTAGMFTLVAQASNQAKEMENLSRLAKMNTQDFTAYAYATESVGVSSEKLADISKDVQDKLGDFIATGGGEFADFFENVAPKVGITAQELQKLSGPDVLIAVQDAMDKANVSAEEQVFYLEAIANDAALLTPLLKDNGAALKEQAGRAKELGVALSEVDHQALIDAKKATHEMTAAFTGAKNEIAAEFAPAFASAVNIATDLIIGLKDEAREFAGIMGNIVTSLQGWEAVAGGRLSFLEFALMDAQELQAWLEKDKAGIAALESQIADYQGRIGELLEKQSRIGLSENEKQVLQSYRDQVVQLQEGVTILDEQISREGTLVIEADKHKSVLQGTVEVHQDITGELEKQSKYAGANYASFTQELTLMKDAGVSAGAQLALIEQNLDDLGKAGDEYAARNAAAVKKAADDRLTLETDLTKKIKGLTLEETDYKIWSLEQEVAQMRKTAGTDKALQDQITQYREKKLAEIRAENDDTVGFMSDAWKTFSGDVATFGRVLIGDALRGEFDGIGDAWKSLLNNMLSDFLGMIAEMMASEGIKWLKSLFTGGDYSFGGFSFGGSGGVDDLMSWGSALKTGASKVGGWLGLGSTASAPAAIASTSPAYVAGGAPLASAPAYSLMPYSTTGTLAGAAGATGTATSVNAGTQLALAEGTYGSSLGGGAAGGGGAAMAGAGVAAAAVFGAKMIAEWGADGTLYEQLQQAAVGVRELQAAGVGDTLTRITGDTAESLDALADDFEAFTHVSTDASGVMYLARESMDGLTTSVDSSVMVLNQATGQWVDQTSAFSAMMGSMSDALAGASEVSMDVVRATAHRIAVERGLPSLEDELAAAFMVNYGAASDLNQAMKMLAAGTASSADSISSAARRVASFRNFDVRLYNPMNEGRKADGGPLPKGYAAFSGGGVLEGGSGIRDDLYLGTINGQAQIAMGGEYIVNPYSTAKHKQLLDYINADRYASGGRVRHPQQLAYSVSTPDGPDIEAILLAIATQVKKTADILRRVELAGWPTSTRVGVSG